MVCRFAHFSMSEQNFCYILAIATAKMNYQRSKDCQVVPNGDIWVVTWGSSKVKWCRVLQVRSSGIDWVWCRVGAIRPSGVEWVQSGQLVQSGSRHVKWCRVGTIRSKGVDWVQSCQVVQSGSSNVKWCRMGPVMSSGVEWVHSGQVVQSGSSHVKWCRVGHSNIVCHIWDTCSRTDNPI